MGFLKEQFYKVKRDDGTGVIDLAMVSAIGRSVQYMSGLEELPWVDIYMKQEPDHVENSEHALGTLCTHKGEEQEILKNAEMVWQLWYDFFTAIQRK